MKRKKLLVILPMMVVAVLILTGIAISGSTYMWEKTFEVTDPELECKIECEIEIGDCRIVGCPVKVWVKLKLEDCGRCWHRCSEEYTDKCEGWDNDCNCMDIRCCCQINGTYSVEIFWWNETQEDWHHQMYLQEEANITLPCWKHVETYTFIPQMEGEYKVVVTFATETETITFSSED
jgi:hypothetical protein